MSERLYFSQLASFSGDHTWHTVCFNSALDRITGLRNSRSSDELETIFGAVARGRSLMNQALLWKTPLVGRDSSLAIIRGAQWRLVMAMAGFEIILKGLFQNNRLTTDHFSRVQLIAHKAEIDPLKPPKIAPKQAEKWLADERVFEFLDVNGHDKGVLKAWMIESREMAELADQLHLIRALRNCTVHAALSATKCKQFGLKPALFHLPETLAKAWLEILMCLCSD